jgi:predicted metalloprotease with PDZ domain
MMQTKKCLLTAVAVSIAIAAPVRLTTQGLAPIVYTVRISAPDSHFIEVEAVFPTGGRRSIELMMPIWSPGYYRVEDYAAQVSDVAAKTTDGKMLSIEKTDKNHWRLETGGATTAQLSYRVFCKKLRRCDAAGVSAIQQRAWLHRG